MIMDLEISEDTFQSSTATERKCGNADVTSHVILTSHEAKGFRGWTPFLDFKRLFITLAFSGALH